VCHRNHRYPIVDFGMGDGDASVAFPFLILEISQFSGGLVFFFWTMLVAIVMILLALIYGTAGLAGTLFWMSTSDMLLAGKLLSKDEARPIAVNVAKLPLADEVLPAFRRRCWFAESRTRSAKGAFYG